MLRHALCSDKHERAGMLLELALETFREKSADRALASSTRADQSNRSIQSPVVSFQVPPVARYDGLSCDFAHAMLCAMTRRISSVSFRISKP